MLFQNKAEAPPRTALVDNAQCHDHVWQLCCRTSPDGQEVGKALVPVLSPARRVGSPIGLRQKGRTEPATGRLAQSGGYFFVSILSSALAAGPVRPQT
jgi:hypothetical protein